ncbi:MAG: hypothetical protein ABEJ89_02045 [Haloarculaceae archaeon]
MAERSAARGRIVEFALTVVAIILVPGLAHFVLSGLGYPTVGTLTWVVGYGSGALYVWYRWIRPLNIVAPDGVSTGEREE